MARVATTAFVGGSMHGNVLDLELEANGKPASLVEVHVWEGKIGRRLKRTEQYLRSDPKGTPDAPIYVYTYFGDREATA
jgi:hypothetical protein